MPGTELTPAGHRALVARLTVAGWLLLGGPLGFIAFQIDRARDVSEQQFAGVWDQRIEVISFLVLPPNVVVLVPVVLVAAFATWLAGSIRDPWLEALLPLAAGIAISLAIVGLVSIVSILSREGANSSDLDAVFLRLGGVSICAGLTMICRAVDRFARAGD